MPAAGAPPGLRPGRRVADDAEGRSGALKLPVASLVAAHWCDGGLPLVAVESERQFETVLSAVSAIAARERRSCVSSPIHRSRIGSHTFATGVGVVLIGSPSDLGLLGLEEPTFRFGRRFLASTLAKATPSIVERLRWSQPGEPTSRRSRLERSRSARFCARCSSARLARFARCWSARCTPRFGGLHRAQAVGLAEHTVEPILVLHLAGLRSASSTLPRARRSFCASASSTASLVLCIGMPASILAQTLSTSSSSRCRVRGWPWR